MKKLLYTSMMIMMLSFGYCNNFEDLEKSLSSYADISIDDSITEISGDKDTIYLVNNGYILKTDLRSFWYQDIKLTYSLDEEIPKIKIQKQNDVIIIKPLTKDKLLIHFGKPENSLLNSNLPIVYIVDHYEPDMIIDNPSRLLGEKRLTAIVKDADVDIENDIRIQTDTLKISTKSFFESSSFENEIDIIKNQKITEIFGILKSIILRTSSIINFDDSFDRGFKITGKTTQKMAELDPKDYIEKCNKFGFVFFPGYGYDFIKETNEFTTDKGFVLGTAYSRYDDFEYALKDMENFIKIANENNLTPIIKILGNNWYNEVLDAKIVAKFVRTLKEKTNDNLKYVQIWDKPNIIQENNNFFEDPKSYANYVYEIKKELNDSDVKIISASLSRGFELNNVNTQKIDADEYLNQLLKNNNFWNSIDYWASSAYQLNETGSIECDNQICADNIYSYQWELNKIKSVLNKNYEIFITDVGYPTNSTNSKKETLSLLKIFKEDLNVKSAILFLGNGWDIYESSTWLNSNTKKLNSFGKEISKEICR